MNSPKTRDFQFLVLHVRRFKVTTCPHKERAEQAEKSATVLGAVEQEDTGKLLSP